MSKYLGDYGKYAHNVENFKRRRALPFPGLAGDAKFFARLLNIRKVHELVFITKAAAKNR
jgi:hypothetical protein